MELRIIRYKSNKNGTPGLLFLDGNYFCHTLELPWKNNQVMVSCIQAGKYKLIQRKESGKGYDQKRLYIGRPLEKIMSNGMIEISDIPGRKWILIHSGNRISSVQGCVLVGDNCIQTWAYYRVTSSRVAYDRLYPIVMGELLKGEDVYIDINWV